MVDSPRNRIVCEEVYLRADKLKRLTPKLEMQLVEHRQESGHLYRTEVSTMSVDTFENRLFEICRSFCDAEVCLFEGTDNGKLSDGLQWEVYRRLGRYGRGMKRLVYHPFFRTVGAFKGMNQESLVLKQGTGYSQVYRDLAVY